MDPKTGRALLASNSEYITAVQMVLADGGVRELRRGVDREFDGVVTSCRSRRDFSFAAMLVVTMFRNSAMH